MPRGKSNSENPADSEQLERKGARIPSDFFSHSEAAVLRASLLTEYNERTGGQLSKYEQMSTDHAQVLYWFTVKTPLGEFTENWNSIANRIRSSFKLRISDKLIFRFLDFLADGKTVGEAAAEVKEAQDLRKKEREKRQESRLAPEMFESESTRVYLRGSLLAEYNRSTGSSAAKYEDISVGPNVRNEFMIQAADGRQYKDRWNLIHSRVRIKFGLGRVNLKSVLKFLDLLADGVLAEEAKTQVLKDYQAKKEERHKKSEQRFSPEAFASADVSARIRIRETLLAEYNQRTKNNIAKYEDISTDPASYGAYFTVKVGGTEYNDSWIRLCYTLNRKYKLKVSSKLLFRFLDLLAEGKLVDEAKDEVQTLHATQSTEREKVQEARISADAFSDSTLPNRSALRAALVAEYNQRTNSQISSYEQMSTGAKVYYASFTVNVSGKDYQDSWVLLTDRLNTKYQLGTESPKLVFRFLDLLAAGQSVNEAKKAVMAADETAKAQREQEQGKRFSVEAFLEGDPASKAKLRELLIAEYNQRTNSHISSYYEISTWVNTFEQWFSISSDGKDYVDSWSAITERLRKNLQTKYQMKISQKSILGFLDLLCEGSSVEEAKAKILGEIETKKQQESTEKEFEQDVENIANEAELLQRFKIWVSIFGPQAAADILFAHNPKYRGIREEFVKGVIADYLGDSLVQPLPFVPGNLRFIEKRFLENPNLQEGLYICLVQACSSYLSRQKANPGTAANILEHFMVDIAEKVPLDAQDLFLEIIIKVATYFRGVFDNWKRPQNMVDKIVEGRDFPDTTQIINILEIKEKQRLLIADRMGVGKSASAIAAKEFLGLRQALVIVPANVIPTWQRYLSDQEKGGYFLQGQEPRVLMVTSVEDLTSDEAGNADYIIISQERLNEEYKEALANLNAEMLIVDEVHKLKSATGVRSEILHEVATQFEGADKYVALLSGTPAPNKVSDIAGILKLLYPERFKDTDVKTIVRQIIYGDITDLRALLVPKMQRKTLAEVVDMPKLIEQDVNITLNPWFQQAYDVILQDDELTSSQKIMAMRQILLNPEILELQPPTGNKLDKISALEQKIEGHFSNGRKKIVVIFNDYIEGVTRGDNNLTEQVNLPAGYQIRVIDGSVPMEQRKLIETEFNESDEPLVLYLSGNTADVGIDLSGAHAVVEYNEPWSKEIKAQQIGRSYRPGLKNDLYVETFITEGSIEEGIHRYIALKDKAIQKLLIGVDLTELEKRLLEEDDSVEGEDYEVDAELAAYYLNSFQDLLSMFKSIKNIGEAKFLEFLARHGDRYAGNYEALGDRSYQSNVARLSANIAGRIAAGGQGPVVNLASGPEMLKSKALKDLRGRIISLDINQAHFLARPEQADALQRKPGVDRAVVSGVANLPLADNSMEAVNLALALHYTSFRPSIGDFERLQTICEMNRVLQLGGRAIITLQHGAAFKDQESFKNLISLAGFEIDSQYSGQAEGENFQAEVFTLIKKEGADFDTLKELMKDEKSLADGLKLRFDSHKKSFRDTRKILTQVSLGGETLSLELNEFDRKALAEEQSVYQLGETLKQLHGEIKDIPVPILREHSFARIKLGNRYILFKNLEESKGVVLIK